MWFGNSKDIRFISDNNSFPAGYDNRGNLCLPGFNRDIQHSSSFGSDLLYMEFAVGLERQFYFCINNLDRRCSRRDNFGNGNQFMRNKYRKYTGCNSNNHSGPTGCDSRCNIGLPGFIQYLQHI